MRLQRNTRRRLLAAALLAVAVAAAGLAPSSAGAEETTVKIDNFEFVPAQLTVKAGTTVTWINADDIPHTVVSKDGVFKSKDGYIGIGIFTEPQWEAFVRRMGRADLLEIAEFKTPGGRFPVFLFSKHYS